MIDPALFPPDSQWLRRIDAKAIQHRVMALVAQLGLLEPIRRKFLAAVRHVLPAEDAQFEHLFWRQVGVEARMETFTNRFREPIHVILLHEVVNGHTLFFIPLGWRRLCAPTK